MQRLTVLGAELPMLFLHIQYPLTRSQFHISPSPLSRHPPHVPNPPHQDLSLDLAIPLPPFHKSVHSSCPFDLGERPSCLLVLYSDEDVDYLQTSFLLANLLKPIYRRIPKTRHCFCIHDNVYLDHSLFPFTWWSFFGQFWLTCALDCKYDNSYSTVGSKPLLGCFTRMFIVSAISNARDYKSSTVSTAF